MKGPYRVSRPDRLVCPLCETGDLLPPARDVAGCSRCGGLVNGAISGTLQYIAALPEAQGKHACDCGHPEMRYLPDGTFHCPACGSEVPPIDASTLVEGFGLSPGPKPRPGRRGKPRWQEKRSEW